MSKSTEMLLADGLPPACLLSAEERAAAWIANPPRVAPAFTPVVRIMPDSPAKKKAKEEDPATTAPAGGRWDPVKCRWTNDLTTERDVISLTTNTRGNGMTTEKTYAEMSGPELVAAYNVMAKSESGVALMARTVNRFPDAKTGIARCEALASSIRARKAGLGGTTEEATEEDDMAKKAKKTAAKKTAKVKSAKIAKVKAVDPKQAKISVEFGCRYGTNKEKLLLALHEDYRKMVPTAKLLKAVYGSQNTENTGALLMVLQGVTVAIENGKLPYEVRKERKDGTFTIGLYPSK